MAIFTGFFLFVLAFVIGAGYLVLRLRPLSEGAVAGLGEVAGFGRLPQPIVTQALHSIGETVPIRGKRAGVLRARLFQAGFRDPSSVAVFQGCRAAVSVLAALAGVWLAPDNQTGLFSALLGAVGMAGAASRTTMTVGFGSSRGSPRTGTSS